VKIALALLVLLLVGRIVWRILSAPRPAYAPLDIPVDDEEMNAAMDRARSTIDELVALYRQHPRGAMVKWPFVTSSGTTENLVGELLGIDGDEARIRLISPPVSHTGQLERLHTIRLGEIVDWVIDMEDGTLRGGFTQRVLFRRGREVWGGLPKELQEQEAKFVDS
jgi:hypothetical protein